MFINESNRLNNFAITSAGIGEALQRSASALFEAGNTIDESIALVTAANAVIQNPEQVGTALKTLALRLRGAKVELEDAGLETDAMAESTSQLQSKLLALTHGKVDIMLNEDTFKNTTQILREMSKAWEDMTDIERASALELMGGKRQANILASVIKNFDTVESAIETSMNSQGSAMAENEKYLDSIQGKTDILTNSMQTLWNNALNSDFMKFLLDVGNALVKAADSAGLLNTALGAFLGSKALTAKNGSLFSFLKIFNNDLTLNNKSWLGGIFGGSKGAGAITPIQLPDLLSEEDFNAKLQGYITGFNNLGQSIDDVQWAKYVDGITASDSAMGAALKTCNIQNGAIQTGTGAYDAYTGAATSAAIGNTAVGTTAQVTTGKLIAMKVAAMAANAALTMGISLLASFVISEVIKGIDAYVHRLDNIREEVKELQQTYEDAKKTFDDNLTSLTTSGDTKLYETLQDEFAALTRGVDKYGNNISLTSDQYERYKAICEQIVSINPQIAAGYDSATKAIGNNASVLSQLIELQKMQQRMSVKNFFAGDNVKDIASSVFGDIKDIKDSIGDRLDGGYEFDKYQAVHGGNETGLSNKLYQAYDWNNSGSKNYGDSSSNGDDLAKKVLQDIGMTDDEIDEALKQFYNEHGYWQNHQFIDAYADVIYNNANLLPQLIQEWAIDYQAILNNLSNAKNNLEESENSFIETLLQVPLGQEEYYNFGDGSRNFITEWIKNSDVFKIDPNASEEEMQTQLKNNIELIKKLVQQFANLGVDAILGEVDNLGDDITVAEYRDKLTEYATKVFESIGGENNAYGITLPELQDLLGYHDYDEDIRRMYDAIGNYLGMEFNEFSKYISTKTLTREEAAALAGIDWNAVGAENIKSIHDVWAIIRQEVKRLNMTPVKTYSALAEEISDYNEVLSKTADVITNNTEVTQEYKDSIVALGVSEEELNECFDKSNKLVVKDAKALNDLVKSAKKNTAENIKLAKSQARLEYYELYKEIEKLRNGQTKLSASTIAAIKAKYQEMGALQKTIAKYSLLEAGLNDVIRTYDEFAEAQEFDSETNYIGKVEEMVIALGEAFNTAKLGTETAQAAIRGLIPEDVYQDIEALDTAKEKMDAIYDYFRNGPIAQYFTLEFDDDGAITSAEMKLGNLRKFIEDGLGLFGDKNNDDISVFKGDWMNFEFSEKFLEGLEKAEDDLGYFAEQMNVSKEVALAFLKTLEDHDIEWLNGDYSSLIEKLVPQTVESEIHDVVQALADLDNQLADGMDVDEYTTKYQELNKTYDELGKKAREDIKLQKELTTQLDEQKKKMQDATNTLNDANATDAEKEAALSTLKEATKKAQELSEKLKGIEVTEITIQFALDNVDAEIAKIENELAGKVSFDGEGSYTVNVDITADELDLLTKYDGLWEEKHNIEVEADPEDAKTALELIESAAQSALDVIDNIDGTTITINTSSAVSNVNALYDALEKLKTVSTATVTVTPPLTGNGYGQWGRFDGTAHASGNWGLPQNEHGSLVGELGPELVVDPSTSRYYTVGDHGAEMVDLKRGSIIFNHKQTEGLLKNGHITSRGKAYASGNAHAGEVTIYPYASSQNQWDGTGYSGWDDSTYDLQEALDGAAGSVEDFAETIDWIEIRMEELDEALGLYNARLENADTDSEKNSIIDQMLKVNQDIKANAEAGAKYYLDKAETYLAGMSQELADAARNGAISITEFEKEQDEATVKAIQNYRDFAQKSASLTQKAVETIAEVRQLAIQQMDNALHSGNVRAEFEAAQNEKLQNAVDFDEERGMITDPNYYAAMMKNSKESIDHLTKAREKAQKEFDDMLAGGMLTESDGTYNDKFYEEITKLYDIDSEIDNANLELEKFQNAINNIYWESFDQGISRLDYLSDETQGLIDIMSEMDMVSKPDNEDGWGSDDVLWTAEGLATLGLHAQEMERAEEKAKMYAVAIADLKTEYDAGHYSESEYYDKLNELTKGQYDAIKAAQEEKEAIVELNEQRVEAIKEGIEKEIRAYEKLIEKKREELSAEKDLYDFQRSSMDNQKNIAEIERKLAALAYDNSMSAVAKRKQLEAELAEARQEQEDLYYGRSIENQQTALDKELEAFQEEKEAEIEKWDKYLEDVEAIVTESLGIVKANAEEIGKTLTDKTAEYGLTVSDAVLNPWKDGVSAIDEYTTKFGDTVSSTVDKLEPLRAKWQEIKEELQEANQEADKYYNKTAATASGPSVDDINAENAAYHDVAPKPTDPPKQEPPKEQPKAIKVGGKITAAGAKIYTWYGGQGYNQYYKNDPIYVVLDEQNGYLKVRHHKSSSGVDGWFKKSDVKAYAKGTTGTKQDALALIDELGDELVMHAGPNGRLQYLTKGTAVIPHDISENLMAIGQLDPSDVLKRSTPKIGMSPSVVNNEVNITMEIAEVVHIDHVDHDTLPDLTKAVRKEMDSYMLKVNNAIRSKVR